MEISGFISEFENLPEYLQKQVMDYIEFLKEKNIEINCHHCYDKVRIQ